jgi:hypothetical protein
MITSRQIAWPAYLVSASMIAIPIVDAATTLYPWRPSDAHWRFGAVGMLSNALLIPTAGLLVALATALVLNQTTLRRTIGVAGFVVAGLCVVALAMFALDSIQTRAAVRPEMRLSFNVASLTAAAKTLLAAVTYFAFGMAAARSAVRHAPLAPLIPTTERTSRPR